MKLVSETKKGERVKREKVLVAAVKELARKGYYGANAAEVAKAAGVSVGTVYRIFKSKEGLANAVYRRCQERFQEFMTPALDHPEVGPRKQFAGVWLTITSTYTTYPDDFIFSELHFHGEFLDEHSRAVRRELTARLMRWTKQLQTQGIVKDLPVEILHAVVIGGLCRLVRDSQDGGPRITAKLLKQMEEFCWQAVSRL